MTDGGVINSQELGLSKDELEKFMIGMQKDGFVEGIIATKDRLIVDRARVTLLGENYLSENSKLAKGYRVAKEIRDWIIPFS